jgi:hypothetical protein
MLVLPLAPADGTSAHVPSIAPSGFMQEPPQHSLSVTQASPIWVQNDGALLHTPSLQYCEQHSAFVEHVLPEVLHSGLSGTHCPSVQTPEQHSPSWSQAWLSDVHWSPEHLKSTHENEQQSGPTEQSPPDSTHVPGSRAHVPVNSSQ